MRAQIGDRVRLLPPFASRQTYLVDHVQTVDSKDGSIASLLDRAGDYVRDVLGKTVEDDAKAASLRLAGSETEQYRLIPGEFYASELYIEVVT